MNSEELAWKIRRHGIEMTHLSKGSHIGSILSVADIIAVLYNDILSFDPINPKKKNRDRVILSKGHAGAAIYAALAEMGFFGVDELKTHYANGSRLSGHVSSDVPGVDFSTGSLGHGLSVGSGMAFACKRNGINNNVFVILGDGECDEGAVWESVLVANHFCLNNLVVIVDYNKMQSLDYCENTISLFPLAGKWSSFGWNVNTVNGHDHLELKKAFKWAVDQKKKPSVIIANTIKGKGISYMENNILWHYRFPHEGDEYNTAINELNKCKPDNLIDCYTPGVVEE